MCWMSRCSPRAPATRAGRRHGVFRCWAGASRASRAGWEPLSCSGRPTTRLTWICAHAATPAWPPAPKTPSGSTTRSTCPPASRTAPASRCARWREPSISPARPRRTRSASIWCSICARQTPPPPFCSTRCPKAISAGTGVKWARCCACASWWASSKSPSSLPTSKSSVRTAATKPWVAMPAWTSARPKPSPATRAVNRSR